jgi:phosphoribosylpyrophosphate synthetase
VEAFPDGEMQFEFQESVRGEGVYFVQPTSPPGEKHLLELLLEVVSLAPLLADAINCLYNARSLDDFLEHT